MTTLATANFNDVFPPAPVGKKNARWQADPPSAVPRRISDYGDNLGFIDVRTSTFEIVGRSGSGKLTTLSNPSAISVVLGAAGLIQATGITSGHAGTGYAVNDTFTIGGAGTRATGIVTAVAAGVVTAFAIVNQGINYAVSSGNATTATLGIGTGLQVDIFSILTDLNVDLVIFIQNVGSSFVTLTPGVGLIDGAPTLVIGPASGAILFWDANHNTWRTMRGLTSPAPPPSGGTTAAIVIEISLAPVAPGNFTVAHGLPATPAFVLIQMDTGGDIWFQVARYDATNIYLTASDAGVVGKAQCWMLAASQEIAYSSSAGNFSVAHGLGATPVLVQIQKTAAGAVWLQTPSADATHVFLTGSMAGITGFVEVWKVLPIPVSSNYARVALAPGVPGNFSVAHGLGAIPFLAEINMTSGGAIWFQASRYDGTSLLLVASDAGITGYADVWAAAPSSRPPIISGAVALAPGSPGNFTVAHGAGAVPKTVVIEMTSGGAIWFQATPYDATNLYLVASDGGLTANAKVIT